MNVTVVMAVYNGAQQVAETIDSVLAQEGADFEFVIVDDGSSDATPSILADYARRDARVRVLHQPNGGLTRALIAGCAAANGTYIARQDAGDRSEPGRFAAQARALDSDDTLAFVSCWTRYTGPRGELLYTFRGSGRASQPKAIIDLNARHGHIDGPTHHGSVMFRRDAYERADGYRSAFRFAQDWDLWYRLAEQGKFQMIEEVLYTARIFPDSITSRSHETQEQLATLMVEMLRTRARGEPDAPLLIEAARISQAKRRTFCAYAKGLYFIGEALRRNGDPRCRSYLLRAGLRCPLLLKSWLRLVQSSMMRKADAHPADV